MARTNITERFRQKYIIDSTTGCKIWIGTTDWSGYGRFNAGKMVAAHRFAYELEVGPIPEDMVIDHTCRTRRCVNVAHLRVASWRENAVENSIGPVAVAAAKTHCLRGHPLSGRNLSVSRAWRKPGSPSHRPPTTKRTCRTCDAFRQRMRAAR